MTEAAIDRMTAPPLLDAFIGPAEVRAYLWSIGELSLREAVDVLQHDAERSGLDADIAQKILANAFGRFREVEQ